MSNISVPFYLFFYSVQLDCIKFPRGFEHWKSRQCTKSSYMPVSIKTIRSDSIARSEVNGAGELEAQR